MKIAHTALVGAVASAAVVGVAPAAHADEVCQNWPNGRPQVVAVGPTSCSFALSVFNAFMSGGGNGFNAYSPATGETYWMNCMVEGHGSTTCRGGNGATVVIY